MINRLAERALKTRFGAFTEILYYDGQKESIALVLGDVGGKENVLCRAHSACIGGHVFNSVECECAAEMAAAQQAVADAGQGLIIYLDEEGKGNGHLALMQSIPFKEAGASQSEAYVMAGYKADNRDLRPAAEMIADLGIESIVLLTDNPIKVDQLRDLSVRITGTRKLDIKGDAE